MHVVISGWLLGPHSGANHRLLAVLAAAGEHLCAGERITVLHRPEFVPPNHARIAWLPVDIPIRPTWRRAIREQFALPSLLRELGATVYDHGFLPPPRLRVPTCLTIHDLRAADGHTAWPNLLARSVLQKACRRAQAIVTPSNYTTNRLNTLVPNTRAKTITAPNAVSVPQTPPGPLPRAMPSNGFLLHVGHLEARKNLAVAIRALALLPPAQAPELWLAGQDAGAGQALARLARERNVAPLVQQLGAVDDATLHSLYSHTRAALLPSIYEGFGMPALEALAYGLPVLAADATALPEVLAGHGWLLPPEQPNAWADAIQTVLSASQDAEQNSNSRARRAYATNAFSWHTTAATYVQTWRSLSSSEAC